MPMVTIDDVLQGVKALWSASPLSGVTLDHGRAQAGRATPYATVQVKSLGKELNSGSKYLESFLVRIQIWGMVADGVPSAMRNLEQLLAPDTSLSVPNAEKTVGVWPNNDDDYSPDRDTKDAQTVLTAVGAWKVMVEAKR